MSEYIVEFGYETNVGNSSGIPIGERIVRCRDCAYYDGEPDMESMGEKCWRDPSHSGRSMPTVADGFCAWAKRKEGGDAQSDC